MATAGYMQIVMMMFLAAENSLVIITVGLVSKFHLHNNMQEIWLKKYSSIDFKQSDSLRQAFVWAYIHSMCSKDKYK